VQQYDNIPADTERRAGLSAIGEPLFMPTVANASSTGIPMSCDVSRYTTEELLSLMNMLDAPREALRRWYQLRVDGPAFAAMSDDDLRLFKVDQPLVRQLRDRSRDSLRKNAPERLAELADVYVTLTPNRDLP